MRTEIKYISDDGNEFDTVLECAVHELLVADAAPLSSLRNVLLADCEADGPNCVTVNTRRLLSNLLNHHESVAKMLESLADQLQHRVDSFEQEAEDANIFS